MLFCNKIYIIFYQQMVTFVFTLRNFTIPILHRHSPVRHLPYFRLPVHQHHRKKHLSISQSHQY